MDVFQMNYYELPLIRYIDYCEASTDFIHQDRVLPYHVLLYVISGEMAVVEDGNEYTAREGEILFLNANCHHWGQSVIPKGSKWYYIHFFSPDIETEKIERMKIAKTHARDFEPSDYTGQIEIPKVCRIQERASFLEHLDKMQEMFFSSDKYRHIVLSTQLRELLFFVFQQSMNSRYSGNDLRIVKEIIGFLKENLDKNITSRDIADHMGMNYKYLCSIFQKQMHVSIFRFYTELRIARAERYLRETNMNISEVSEALGFNNPLYFSSVFKKVTGMCPTAYLEETYSRMEDSF